MTDEARFAAIEARMAALEGRLTAGAPATHDAGPELDDKHLDNDWADKIIAKDPPRYNGPTMVGKKYSQASSHWLEVNAGFLDWKAAKGREEVPVRLNNKGKPWHEADTFTAKICRAWARRNAGKSLDALTAEPAASPFPFAGPAATDDVIPF